ncbi:hypothetical protein GCM10009087_01750 [Sphingomonas oligophenolica]|uniref:Sulfur globule protein n=1 Tax=Sphingomonas oligophenolica TaxID=301154 RepID=A0ABU9Y0Y0_9SPHN
MKISHIFAATGLMVAAMTASTSATAQEWRGDHGRWHHDYDRGWDRGWDHGRDRGWHDRRYWHGPRWRPARYHGYGWRYPHCWTEWRWHHRVRICR